MIKNLDLTLWCPKCKEMHYIGMRAKFESCFYRSTGNFRASDLKNIHIEFSASSLDLTAICDRCGYKFIVLDTGVTECIELLNNNQRYTIYSCQGHIDYYGDNPYLSSAPYITFAEIYDDFSAPVFVKGLPKNWSVKEDSAYVPMGGHKYVNRTVTEFFYDAYADEFTTAVTEEEIKRINANKPMDELYVYLAEYFKK
jgi:hypothetical protein